MCLTLLKSMVLASGATPFLASAVVGEGCGLSAWAAGEGKAQEDGQGATGPKRGRAPLLQADPMGSPTWLLEEVRLRLLLAAVGEGADDGEEVVPLALVLVVMLPQQHLSHPRPRALLQLRALLLLAQEHVWGGKGKGASEQGRV